DTNGDGISGRVHWVHPLEDPEGPLRAGRFGGKAQGATGRSFSADAARNEMGITNRLIPTENAPNNDTSRLAGCDQVPEPEAVPDGEGLACIDRVTDFQRYLAVPPQTPKSGMAGESIFVSVGCAQCHVPEWTTSNAPALEPALRGKVIRPYSDFLLHDMGLLGDGVTDGYAGELEMRTPTLWNLRTRDPMLHSGAASGGTFSERVRTAVALHGPYGEGAASAEAFSQLPEADKARLVAFLDSLGRIEFDANGDGHVDQLDLPSFRAAYGHSTNPNLPSAVHDIDQNGVVNGVDLAMLAMAYEPTDSGNADCNGNGIADMRDIATGTSADANVDGIPDECIPCRADLNLDRAVDGNDLGILLGAWGTANPVADLDSNGAVNG
ncbi:MAG: di-heme oxidoredictase family protein, partial [Phycisphaerales bacterium]